MNLLTVKDLSFQRKGYFAYKHVTFSLSQNEAIGITGDNGSGKTALLETLVELNYADSGLVQYNSGTRVSFMPQIETQVIEDTVGDYLESGRALAGDQAVSADQLKDLSAYMGMSPFMDRKVSDLSVGFKQRVSFLDAVSKRPNVLILDNPFSFQNTTYSRNMVEIFKDLQNHGAGIIVADSKRENILEEYFDTRYSLEGKSLIPFNKNQRENFLLAFRSTENSMAMTREMAGYMAGNMNGLIELRVPLEQKEHVLGTMLDMNYLFEGMENLEV